MTRASLQPTTPTATVSISGDPSAYKQGGPLPRTPPLLNPGGASERRGFHYERGLLKTMPPLQRPCLDCGTPTRHPRCPTCEQTRRTVLYDNTDYRNTRAAFRRDAITTGQLLHCWLCQQPIDPTLAWPDLRSLTTDHVHPADPTSPLRPAHLHCNSARGNRDQPPTPRGAGGQRG